MQKLKPIYDHDKYSKEMETAIFKNLYYAIFSQLFQILNIPKSQQNAKTTQLEEALKTGKLKYQNGFFVGRLNAALSKQLRGIGATYNRTRKAYSLALANLPQDIKLAVREGQELARAQLRQVEDYLKAIEGRKLTPMELEPFFGSTVTALDKQFHTTTKRVTGADLEIPIADRLKDKLKKEYTENLQMYVQDWHDEQVLRLKKQVAKNVSEGFRAEKLVDSIVAERGVTWRKAQFLARQETSLMVSKYRQIRYEEIGIQKYQWSTSHDLRVRHDHRELNGRIFRYDEPPITDKSTGARNNPGEDYNCRCVAIPVLTTRDVLEREYATANE